MACGTRWMGLLLAAVVVAGCGVSAVSGSGSARPSSGAGMTSIPTAAATPTCRNFSSVNVNVELAPFAIAGWQVAGQFPGFATPGWETDDIALKSTVVAAQVVSEGGGFQAEGSPGIWPNGEVFTPALIRVFEVLHGSAQPGDMTISTEGGTFGCQKVSVDIAPTLQVGRRYVLFLGMAVSGNPLVMTWDEAWPIDGSGLVQTPGGPMTITDLTARIERLAAAASATPGPTSSGRP